MSDSRPMSPTSMPPAVSGPSDRLLLIRTTVVWAALSLATVVSWLLGTHHSGGASWHSIAILVIAFAKIRLVGLYFMELRDAPIVLRGVFEAYCVVVCIGMIGMLLLVQPGPM